MKYPSQFTILHYLLFLNLKQCQFRQQYNILPELHQGFIILKNLQKKNHKLKATRYILKNIYYINRKGF